MRPAQSQRRLLPLLVACNSVGIVVLAVLVVVVFQANGERSSDIEGLVCSAHREKVKRIANTIEYLRTPVGRRRSGETGGLNAYIARVSLPQLKKEAARERAHLPASCAPRK